MNKKIVFIYIIPLVIAILIASGFVYYENLKTKKDKPAAGNIESQSRTPENNIEKSQSSVNPIETRSGESIESSNKNPNSILDSAASKNEPSGDSAANANDVNNYNSTSSQNANYSNPPAMLQSGSYSTSVPTPTKSTTTDTVANPTMNTNLNSNVPKTSAPPSVPEVNNSKLNLPDAPVSSQNSKPSDPNLSAPSGGGSWQPPVHDATNS
jgi:hypothetical protein